MSVYHIRFAVEDDWYILHSDEDEGVYSQARTLDEAVLMIRDVLDLVKDERDAELRLIIPANLPVDDTKQSGRLTHGIEDGAEVSVNEAESAKRASA